jgi:two-component system, OmpR family, sensor histidine kinase KdpD
LPRAPLMLHSRWRAYAAIVAIVIAATALNWVLSRWLTLTDLAMVYLLGVVVAAAYFERNASIACAVLSFIALDFFFVPPHLTLHFTHNEHLITGVVLLIVGVSTSALAARVREEMQRATHAAVLASEEQLRNSLLASLSHDLRTPLAVIAGSASTLRENRSRLSIEEQDQLLEAIIEQSRIMSLEVSDVLEMTRLHAGPVTLNRQWYPLEELIGAALERCKTKLSSHEVTVRLPPETPMVHVDGVLLEKLFVNLLENAAKYTPPGTHIAIGAMQSDGQSDGHIDVIVEDDGPGIPENLSADLFEKFTRADSESAVAGSGLGLSICRAIAQLHEMRLTAENRPQGGARFVLSIPYVPPPTAESEA